MTVPYYGGMYHPGVIQTPGAGEAFGSGLGAVLQALLERKQLDQQQQGFQTQQEQRKADTQEAGARTGLYQQQTSDLAQKAKLENDDRQAMLTGRALVMANAKAASDPVAFAQLLSTASPAVAQHALDFRNTLLKGNEQGALANEAQARANVATAEAPGKIAASKLEDVLGADVAGKVATDPNFRRLAAYAKAGLLPLITERERSAAELARTKLSQDKSDTAMERAQLHENFRTLLQQNGDDLKLTQGYAQQRSLAQLAGNDALKQFDQENPKVTPASLEQYHAQQMGMQVPEYRMWRSGVLRQGAALMNGTKLPPDEQKAIRDAVGVIKSGKGSLDQWRAHVSSSGMNPALVAEVEAALGSQSK